jgi:mycothiol synthase
MSSSPPETRPATLADADAVADVVHAFDIELVGRPLLSAADIRVLWTSADLPTGSWLVERNGRLDAVAWVALGNAWESFIASRPGYRGLEPFLLDLAEQRVREAGGSQLRLGVLARDDLRTELVTARGYEPVRYFYEMRMELNGPPPAPEWPEGIRPAAFRPEDARAFFDAIDESFADEWGFRSMPFDEWRRVRVDESDISLYFVAWDGDEVAGFARCEERGADGFVGMLGVRPRWRKRGIGEALLRHAFGAFHGRGKRAAALGVDAENPSGATRLYERVGMHVANEDVVYEKALA